MAESDERIGGNVARLRGAMSQADLADKLRERGLRWSQTTVWEVEKGRRALKLAEAEEVADVFGVPLEMLLIESDAARLVDGVNQSIDVYNHARDGLYMSAVEYMDARNELLERTLEARNALASESATDNEFRAVEGEVVRALKILDTTAQDDSERIVRHALEHYDPIKSAFPNELRVK